MQHVVRCGSITVAAAVHRYTEHVNDRLLTAACVLQVLLFLQEEEEESSPETQMKTNKGTCGSPLHICSFCFFLSPLSSSSPLLTGVSWYTGFYWSGPSSEESVCCLYQQRSPCVFMAKDWSETRAAQTAAGKHVAVRLQLATGFSCFPGRLASHFPPFPLLSGSEERRVCLWGYMREDSKYKRAMSHTSSLQIDFMDKEMQLAQSFKFLFLRVKGRALWVDWTISWNGPGSVNSWIPFRGKTHDHQNQKFKRSLCKIDALFPVLICN